jgi:hypothetical protein
MTILQKMALHRYYVFFQTMLEKERKKVEGRKGTTGVLPSSFCLLP